MSTFDYNAYLTSSPVWQRKRLQCFNRFGRMCAVCRSTKHLQVHHRTYKRIGKENVEIDLIPLCSKHHKKLHEFCVKENLDIWLGTQEYLRTFNIRKVPLFKKEKKSRRKKHKQKPRPSKEKSNEYYLQWWLETVRAHEAKKNQPTKQVIPT